MNVTRDVGFAVVRGIGQNVEAVAEPESTKHQRGDHPVYRLVKLLGTDGKVLIFAERGDEQDVTIVGTVKRINYAKNGAADGVILDSGDLVHLSPAGMKNSGLKVGDQVTAEGTASVMPLGQQFIEAKIINGAAVSKKPAHRPPPGELTDKPGLDGRDRLGQVLITGQPDALRIVTGWAQVVIVLKSTVFVSSLTEAIVSVWPWV